MAELSRLTLSVGDRRLNAWLGGAPNGLVLLFHPGTPFPPVHWGSLDAAARDRGLRLVTYARPGYSGSTRLHGRSVADVVTDVSMLLDHLGADEFVTMGHSGGGPHALACAALLPDRCSATVALSSVAPYDSYGEGWMSGMAEENVEEFTAALKGEPDLKAFLAAELDAYAAVTGDAMASALRGLVSEIDRESLTGELADFLARSLRSAAADGLEGWIDDDLAFVKPWRLDFRVVETPVTIWHGRHDRMVPFSHGEWLLDHVPHSKSRLFDSEGHISLLTRRLGDILDDLVQVS